MRYVFPLTVIIMSQCICIPNYHVSHLKYTIQFFLINYASIKLGKNSASVFILLRCHHIKTPFHIYNYRN